MNINAKIAFDSKTKRELVLYERRQKVAEFLRENPYVKHATIAEALGVNKSTISRDIREMNTELKEQTMDDLLVHRTRVLDEIHTMKKRCVENLDSYEDKTKGSRWVEEWSTLVEKECKILGLYSPERIFIGTALSEEITSAQKDAAVDAVVKVIMQSAKKGKIPQLPSPDKIIDVTDGSTN